MSDHRIRLASAADVSALRRLVTASFEGYLPRLGGLRPAPMDADDAGLVAAGLVHVVAIGGDLAGMVVLRPEPDHLLLETIAVSPARQGTGIGRFLLRFAEAQAEALGLPELRLYTAEAMIETLALYRRCGWLDVARAAPTGIPRVFMRKPLPRRR